MLISLYVSGCSARDLGKNSSPVIVTPYNVLKDVENVDSSSEETTNKEDD